MKVLFIASGNTIKFGIPPLVKIQGDSLKKSGVDVVFFPLVGKGFKGYLGNIFKLRKYIRNNPVDIIHAHYSFAGVVVSLINSNIPLVVSLLGSDVHADGYIKKIILRIMPLLSWKALIVKSIKMSEKLQKNSAHVIPNGVDISLFKPLDTIQCKKKLFWDVAKKHILFVADPARKEKNFSLTQNAINLIGCKDIELHHLENTTHSDIPILLNASDVIVLSSLWEGSPNVIKEAMSCNCPIVATNVGDIEWLFGNEPGHFIADFSPKYFAKKIEEALNYSQNIKKTNGRRRILELGLDSETIARKIIDIYDHLALNQNK